MISTDELGYNFKRVTDGNNASCINGQKAVRELFSYQPEFDVKYEMREWTQSWKENNIVILNVHFDATMTCSDRKVSKKNVSSIIITKQYHLIENNGTSCIFSKFLVNKDPFFALLGCTSPSPYPQPPPQRDLILSFPHTFSPESTGIRDWSPPPPAE